MEGTGEGHLQLVKVSGIEVVLFINQRRVTGYSSRSVGMSVCLSVYSESTHAPGCNSSTVFVPWIASTQQGSSVKFGRF